MAQASKRRRFVPALDWAAWFAAVAIAALTVLDQLGKLHLSDDFLTHAVIYLFIVVISLLVLNARLARSQIYASSSLGENVRGVKEILAATSNKATVDVPSQTVGPKLQELLEGSTAWRFRGGSGRWQIDAVLPKLTSDHIRDSPYKMQVIDSRNRELCERYAHYRSRQRPPSATRPDESKPERVRNDILTCIYLAAWHMNKKRLKPEIYFLSTYSPLRYDVGDGGLMITVADLSRPALFAPRDGWFYSFCIDEFDTMATELPSLVLPKGGIQTLPRLSDVSGDDVRHCLQQVEIREPNSTTTGPLIDDWVPTREDYDHIAAIVSGRGGA